jgi:hypothetical protein
MPACATRNGLGSSGASAGRVPRRERLRRCCGCRGRCRGGHMASLRRAGALGQCRGHESDVVTAPGRSCILHTAIFSGFLEPGGCPGDQHGPLAGLRRRTRSPVRPVEPATGPACGVGGVPRRAAATSSRSTPWRCWMVVRNSPASAMTKLGARSRADAVRNRCRGPGEELFSVGRAQP